jgi:hypothetical protein
METLMGKAPKPLKIGVHPDLSSWKEWLELSAQGHTVTVLDTNCDLVVGPNSWYLTEAHKKYLPLAIKAARAVRYKKK